MVFPCDYIWDALFFLKSWVVVCAMLLFVLEIVHPSKEQYGAQLAWSSFWENPHCIFSCFPNTFMIVIVFSMLWWEVRFVGIQMTLSSLLKWYCLPIQWCHPRAETGVARAEYHTTIILVSKEDYPFLPKAQFWKSCTLNFPSSRGVVPTTAWETSEFKAFPLHPLQDSFPTLLLPWVLHLFWYLFCNDLSRRGTLHSSASSSLWGPAGMGRAWGQHWGWWRWEGTCWNTVLLVLGHHCLLESSGLELLDLLEK